MLPNDTGIKYTIGSQVDTPWTEIEFEVAAHMIYEGMVWEGLRVLRTVYDRYAKYGVLWNHIECGSYYYLAMDSWLVLIALQGLFYNGFDRSLRFAPKLNKDRLKSLFTVAGAWGMAAKSLRSAFLRGR
ncbi:MAG: GH116 family glycosyl hydrolase [Crenarchaeota archaeon]|nr:GH116 family glycosyl hydrolase [Thermoproteota archaeon]